MAKSQHHQQMHQMMNRIYNSLLDIRLYSEYYDLPDDFLKRKDGTYPFEANLQEMIARVDHASYTLYDIAHKED